MRNRNALTESGRPELLALVEAGQDRRRLGADALTRKLRQLLK
jgi:hypothetical protein